MERPEPLSVEPLATAPPRRGGTDAPPDGDPPTDRDGPDRADTLEVWPAESEPDTAPEEPAEPLLSAYANAGMAAIAAPTPNATANAPTRPT